MIDRVLFCRGILRPVRSWLGECGILAPVGKKRRCGSFRFPRPGCLIRLQPRRVGIDQRVVQDLGVAVEGLRIRGLARCQQRIDRRESGRGGFRTSGLRRNEAGFVVLLIAGEALADLVFGRCRVFVG